MSVPGVVRFGVFADAHYADRLYGDRYCRDSAAKLQACVRHLTAADLDFAVCMGDLIDTAPDRDTEIGYARTMAEIFAGYGGARHWVLGNHDVSGLSKSEFLQACGAEHPPHYSFEAGGAHFVVLDGNCHADGGDFCAGDFSWDEAWVAPAQVDWLAADLAAAADRPVVVFCHENIDHRLWEGALDPHVVRNAADVRQVLEAAGNVAAVVQAHYHPGLQTEQGGIPFISLRAMVVGPGLANNAFAVLQVHPDGALIVQGHGQQCSFTVGGG